MKAAELRQKAHDELKELLHDYEKRRDAFRFEASRKKMKNVRELRELKKDIARIQTLLVEKNI